MPKGFGHAKDKKHIFLTQWNRFDGVDGNPLPEPVPEFMFAKPWKRLYRADWAFPEHKILIEVDGGNHIVRRGVAIGHHTTASDYEKLNIAAALGYRVFRFTPRMLENEPEKCVSIVAGALATK